MGLPKDLFSRATKPVHQPAQPSVQEVINGGNKAATPEELEGVRVMGALSARNSVRDLEAFDAHRKAKAEAERARDDAIIAEVMSR
jgi:hypothetical protein